ncbi:MAG: hypothetical protein INQ03_16200 [Candidatus Heimdallarchaeota archaeon]|nr:hypothetical protein [Candidatus Heimdallarchaeota archaeon]
MEVDNQKYVSFLKIVVKRGLGLYGPEKMAQICHDSNILLLDDHSIQFNSDNYEEITNDFIKNYVNINLIAKMTVIALAKQYDVPVADEIVNLKKKKSRFKRIFDR